LLYDVTSTYLKAGEGNPRPSVATRAISAVATTGLPRSGLHARGLPLSFEVFAQPRRREHRRGDRHVDGKQYGVAERVWVMDRGMVSEANLAFPARTQGALPGRHAEELAARHERTLLEQTDGKPCRTGLRCDWSSSPEGSR